MRNPFMPQRATPDLELLHLVTENKGSFWPRKFGLKPSRKLKSACLKETEQMDPLAQIWPVVSVLREKGTQNLDTLSTIGNKLSNKELDC